MRPARKKSIVCGFETLESRHTFSVAPAGVPLVNVDSGGPVTISPSPVLPTGGVTINQNVGVGFTANVGTLDFPAPGSYLRATINWGDGKSSAGILQADGGQGVDLAHFQVVGSHTYLHRGTYNITVTVTNGPISATPVGTIKSKAIVQALDGAVSGTYVNPLTRPDAGASYVFAGSGTAGDLGAVKVSGQVSLPGNIRSGHAAGTVTLTNAKGSVTLSLSGPEEPGFGPFPKSLAFSIDGGTGAYAGMRGAGSIAVLVGNGKFTFILHSV